MAQTDPRIKAFFEKYGMQAYWADGEYYNLKAVTDFLWPRSVRKQSHHVYVKSSAGASMDESANDKGRGLHPVIKRGYKDPEFKWNREYPWPTGAKWNGLREELQELLDPADYKTLGKAVACAKEICSKALTMKNTHSAFEGTHAIDRDQFIASQSTTDTIDLSNAQKIMSGNKHWCGLDTTTAKGVLDLIPDLSSVVTEHGYVPEDIFDSQLAALPGADNTKPIKTGCKDLNVQAVQYQRCSILGDAFFRHRRQLIVLAAQRKRSASTNISSKVDEIDDDGDGAMEVQGGVDTTGKARKRILKCAGCSSAIAGTSTKCKASYCQKQYCSNVACMRMLLVHEPLCLVQAQKKKDEKKAAKNAGGSTK